MKWHLRSTVRIFRSSNSWARKNKRNDNYTGNMYYIKLKTNEIGHNYHDIIDHLHSDYVFYLI